MTAGAADVLRRATAHQLVADVDVPVLDDAAAHHLFRVLRIRDGETVTVTDGSGHWRACRAVGGDIVVDTDVATVGRRDPVTVGFAIPKAERPEWIVQKLTELGIDRILLLHAANSVVRWDADRSARHLAKLQRVAVEALQQSRGVWLPEVTGPMPAADLLPRSAVAEPGGRPITDSDRTLLVGPEGGWTDAELEMAGEQIALAPTVLRVETAVVVAGSRLVAHRLAVT